MEDEIELYKKAAEVEKAREISRNRLEKAKERSADRLDGVVDAVWDAIAMALQSEDEAIRLKAALAMADRLVPKVGVDKSAGGDEVIEVIPDSRKRLLEDIELELKKKGLGGSAE